MTGMFPPNAGCYPGHVAPELFGVLPVTGYEHSGGPEPEFYPPDKLPDETDYHSEIWIPVIKK